MAKPKKSRGKGKLSQAKQADLMARAMAAVMHHRGVRIGSVVLAGLAAAAWIVSVDLAARYFWLGQQWALLLGQRGVNPLAQAGNALLATIVTGLLAGQVTAWLYAAIRPRFGAGWHSALLAGAYVLALTQGALMILAWSGLAPWALWLKATAASALALLPASLIAGWLYNEA